MFPAYKVISLNEAVSAPVHPVAVIVNYLPMGEN